MKKYPLLIVLLGTVFLLFIYFTFLSLSDVTFLTPDFGRSDILHQNIPNKLFLAESIGQERLPYWNRGVGMGVPQFAEGQIGSLYILNLLTSLLPIVWAMNLSYWFSLSIALVGMFLFLRALKLHPVGSFLGACAFTFSGYMIVKLVHINMVFVMSLFPLGAYVLHQFLTKKSRFFLLFFVLIASQQIFAGSPQMSFISFLGYGSYIAFSLFNSQESRKHKFMTGLALVGSFLGTLALSLAQILPTAELLYHSIRRGGVVSAPEVTFPYPFSHVLTFLNPYFLGDPRIGTYPRFNAEWGIFWENTAYIGIVPLLLFFFGILLSLKKKSPLFIFISAMTFVSFLLVLGKNAPTYFLFEFSPFSLFRAPSRFLFLTIFGMSTLASYALSVIITTWRKKRVIFFLSLLLVVFSLADLLSFGLSYHLKGKLSPFLTCSDTAIFLKSHSTDTRVVSLAAEETWNETFVKNGWYNEILMYQTYENSLSPYLNSVCGVDQFDDYGIMTPRRLSYLKHLIREGITSDDQSKTIQIDSQSLKLLGMASVQYILTPYTINNPNLPLVYSTTTQPSYQIYKNQLTLPRIFAVRSLQSVSTVEELRQALLSPSFQPEKTALIEEAIDGIPTGPTDDVKISDISIQNGAIQGTVEQTSESLV
ncbi:MAG TPA: hypothetical protein VJB91_02070, partial [Patescibacteria group bacterium]|nr:hypothetical protein [Patescibacteria group bacterium]